MSRNRHHPVRLAKGGKRLAPDKREGVGLIATAGMAAVVALISILCIAFGGVAVADEDVTGERVESQDLAVLMVPLVESWDLEAADEPQRIEEALVAQGYFRNDVPLTYEEQDYLHTACEEAQIPYALALAMIQQETQFRNMVGDGGDSEGYMEQERKRREAEEAARKAAEEETRRKLEEASALDKEGKTEEAEAALTEAEIMETAGRAVFVPSSVPKAKGVSASADWEITGIDSKAVPLSINGAELRPVDKAAVMRLIRASKGTIQIPGITYRETKKLSFSKK